MAARSLAPATRHAASVTTRLRVVFVLLALVVVVALSLGPITAQLAGGRVRSAAAAHGLTVSWRKLTASGLGRVKISRIIATRAGADGAPDSLFQADSLDVALDIGSLMLLHPRVEGLGLWHAEIHLPT